jgi:hypothetical protein
MGKIKRGETIPTLGVARRATPVLATSAGELAIETEATFSLTSGG